MRNFHRKGFRFLLCMFAAILACWGIGVYFAGNGNAASAYKTSWIGNSFGGGEKWVQNYIEAMYVSSDGTIYTNSTWDEGGREAGIYKNGDVVAKADDLHGWNRLGGKAVTADSKYLYVAMFQGAVDRKDQDYPRGKEEWYCIRRYDLSGKPAPFPGGRGWDKSMLIVSEKNPVLGLATWGKELYVSEEAANQVHVYNTQTMKKLRSFSVSRPGQIVFDRQGNLWILQAKKDSAPQGQKIFHYSKQGKQLPQQVTNVVQPSAIAVDNRGRLLVGENGPNQQVLIYEVKNKPTIVGTFGVKGGIFAGKAGEIGDLRLYGISGIGTDSQGNIYVNNNGFNNCGTDLRKFSPQGKLQWQLMGLHFVDNADTDPNSDGVSVYGKHEYYQMDYSKPAGKKWNYKAYTVNPFKYPDDPRLHTSPTSVFFRRIEGKPFMFLTDMYNSFLQIYRFDLRSDGYIAIPSAMFVNTKEDGKYFTENWPRYQPEKGEWIWRDKNGNGAFDKDEYETSKDYPYVGGWWVDSKGNVWKTLRTEKGIRRFAVQGLDGNGNPIYNYKGMDKQENPKTFTDMRRLEYISETDTMYISGFTAENPQSEDEGKKFGSEIARYDNWSKGNRKERFRITVPYDTKADPPSLMASMSAAGNYIFTILVKSAEVYVYNAATGDLVKQFKPGPEVANESGWIDIPYGIRAFRRKNGEYIVFAEEDWKGKVIVYSLPAKIGK
ncbi:MAG: hypothetical protein KME64_26840 [Scytonematopsis contorta HA4267-MV1]|nr:hypothetical protein [Scytonematopsis contorta HA4267-MV1]